MTWQVADIVVIGGSAGGIEALRRICEGLPADFPAAVFVVLHISPKSRSVMPELLRRAGKLPARHPQDDEPINRGVIYVAPPDMHMLCDRATSSCGAARRRTSIAPRSIRCSVPLRFAYGSHMIGVLLSGLLDDGCAGLLAIKSCGGLCVVQEPNDAMWSEMPRNALAHANVDHCVPVADMPDLLVVWCMSRQARSRRSQTTWPWRQVLPRRSCLWCESPSNWVILHT